MSNYKPVDGIIIPHTMETHMDGVVQSTITVEEILYDEDIEVALASVAITAWADFTTTTLRA